MSRWTIGVLVVVAVLAARPGSSAAPRRVRAVLALPPRAATAARLLPVAAAGAAAIWVFGARIVLATGLASGLAVIAGGRLRRRRLARSTRQAVVELCRALAGELRAGRPVGVAVAVAAANSAEPLRGPMCGVVAVAARGDPVEIVDAMWAASSFPACDGLGRLAVCWRVAAASGAALAPAVDRVADALADEIELRDSVAASLAGSRSTLRLLAALPLLGLGLGTAIGAQPVRFLLGASVGQAVLAGALLLDLAGLVWSRRISDRAARLG